MRQAQWISWIIATIFVHAITACYYPLQLSEPRSGASIAAVDNKMYFISSPNAQFASSIDVLDTETNSWSVMQLDPPRTTVISLGVGSRYLFLFGGQLSNPRRVYQFIDVLDVTTNEKYSIPFANGWSNFATPVGVNIHILQKVVIYVQSATVHESNILIVDPATRSVQEISSDRIRHAVSNGTHLFAATRTGPKALDVDQLTWSDLSDFPSGNLQSTRWRAYLPSKNAIVVTTDTSPPRVQVIGLNGTIFGSRTWARQAFNLLTFSETEIYSIQPGTLTVTRFEDFHEITYLVPQTFFQGGLFNLFHNGVMYITSLPLGDIGVMTINSNALFTRAQFELPPSGERITFIAADILFSISANISWFDMNTRQYRTQDWPTRRNLGPIAVTKQHVVLAGGIDPNTNEPSNAVDVFDTTTQTWMSTTMPYAFRPGRVLGSDAYAFFFVGRDQFYAYHIRTNKWQSFTMENPLDFDVIGNIVFASQPRTLQIANLATGEIIREIVSNGAIGVPVRQRYYFAVGLQGEVVLYDTTTDTEQHFHLGVARAQVLLEVVQDRYIVIAGGSPRSRVDVFDMETLTSTSADLPVYARGNTVLMTVVNNVVIFARHRRIDQFNPATMEFSEIFLEVDDITRVHSRGSKVMFISDYSITIYETSTREYFTARFENYRVLDPSANFIVARLDGKIEYRPITTMTRVMDSATIFEGDSTTFSTSVTGPYSTVRWSRGDEELVEANDMFNLHIDNAMQSDDGVYQMEVRDLCNQRMQQQARLTVHGRPVFVEPLDDTVNLCDEPSVIETQVVGKNVTFEWRIDGHLQPSMTSENITIAPNDLQCDRSYSLCLTATNPSGPNTTCASLKLVKVDSLFAGPLPREIQSSWFTGTQVDLVVQILDSDCTSHSWLIDNQIIEEHDAMQSVYRVNISLLIKNRQFTVVAQCGNSEVRSRPFMFTGVSTLKVAELVVIIIIPIVALIVAAVFTIFFRRRLVKSEHAELELQTLLTQAKTDSLRRDGVSVIPSTKWEWTPTDDFTYRPVDALPCKIDLSMIQMKTEPMRVDVWMQNEMIFSYGAKSTNSSLKERLLDGLQVDIYSPQSPKYEIKVEPASFVIKEGKSVHVTVSSMMRMTAKCKISLVLVLDQYKMYSAVEYKIESVMSTWIDLDEIQMTGQFLGGGGFGSVTRGVYRGQQVAVKKLLSQYLTPDMKTEFEREVTLMKDLRHPNIVSFVGASNVDDNLAIVLEYAPLGSLSSTMKKAKLSTSMKLTVLYETAKAIQFLHMNSVIHRDIKPQNILVFSLEPKSPVHIKLTDFGTSRFISEDKMTVTKNVGTISYMAPEALGRNPRIDKSADVYSFAILMWEVMFEQQPFAEFQWDSAIEQHVNNGKRLPLSNNGAVNPSLIALIEECWKQEPSARPQINSVVERLSLLMQQSN